ncbi:MAG: metalloregulator ArsR/SmtB family transcription factor [Alphaproteobacteria bacterium]|jgi:DNA-binding transcriptional ArsR family regulator|nr:metalloregulator ArsR/SmtB family transcription factor [Alphaproteobacteria bacterium]
MDAVLRALAEPNRRKILSLVRDGEKSAGEIAEAFAISRPAVSQHLKVLEAAGLVSVRKAGTRRLYKASREPLAELKAFVDAYWQDGLARLKDAAEAEQRRLSDG